MCVFAFSKLLHINDGDDNEYANLCLSSLLFLFIYSSPSIPIRYRLYRARVDPYYVVTQDELNKLHEGPHFRFAESYATLLSTFFVCMSYNLGIPILNLIALINFMDDKLNQALEVHMRLQNMPQASVSVKRFPRINTHHFNVEEVKNRHSLIESLDAN